MFFLLTFSMFWLASSLCRLHRFTQEIQKHPHEPVHVQEHKALWCCRTESGRTSAAQELKSGEVNNNSAVLLFFFSENTKIYSPKRQTATTTKRILNCGKHFHYVLNTSEKDIFAPQNYTTWSIRETPCKHIKPQQQKRNCAGYLHWYDLVEMMNLQRAENETEKKKRQKCHVGCLIIAPRVHLC